ncbi:MAG: hypothetical protein KIS73_22690 [Enhydrobacter sp.]|nr:hypothetical protein [Enhydrobacter sp.]
MTTLNEDQAYAAMYHFLEDFYRRTNSDDVGSLLSSMSLLADERPADPAIAKDWQRSVRFAADGGKAGYLVATPVDDES